MRRLLVTATLVFGLSILSGVANANPGLRLGLTDDPDTIFIGAHYNLDRLGGSPGARIELVGDLGFGDSEILDIYTLRFSGNFKYLVRVGRRVAVYPIAGISLYRIAIEDVGSDNGVGINAGGGLQLGGFAVDVTLGIEDVPDITLAISFTFR